MLDAATNAAVITPDGRPQVERRRRLSQAALALANQKVHPAYSLGQAMGGDGLAVEMPDQAQFAEVTQRQPDLVLGGWPTAAGRIGHAGRQVAPDRF